MNKRKYQDVLDSTQDVPMNNERKSVTATKNRKNQPPSPSPPVPLLPLSSSSLTTSSTDSPSNTRSKKRNRKSPLSFTNIKSATTTSTTDTCEHRKTIRITQEDHDHILQLLQSIDWSMAKNTSRKNVIRDNDPSTPRLNGNHKKGKPYCQSFIFGRNMKDPNYEYSYWSQQYPAIDQALQQFFHKYNTTHFTYTHMTLNKNLQCKRHTDGGNMGWSYIIAFGHYTGGQLRIEPPTIRTTNPPKQSQQQQQQQVYHPPNGTKICDSHRTFVLFNGKEQPHETLPFTGERYTLVYYTSDIFVPPQPQIQPPPLLENGLPPHPAIQNLPPHSKSESLIHPITIDHTATAEATESATATTTITTTMASRHTSSLAAKFNAIKKKLGRKR